MFQFAAGITLAAWIASIALMQLWHAIFRHLPFTWRYVIGAATICAACSFVGLVLDNALLAIVPWVIASAGATIIINYTVEANTARADEQARKAGELVGMTKGITRDLIGGEHGTGQPTTASRSREN